jgi:hypothetical protein
MADVLDGLHVEDVGGESGVLKYLLNVKNYKIKKILSEIPPDLVYQMSTMNVVATRFKSKVLHSACEEIYEHQSAKDRKARLEIVEIGSSQARALPEED